MVASSDALADDRPVDAAGLDLDFVVTVPKRLRNEREPEDADPRVEPETRLGAKGARQPVLGVDRSAEVGSDGTAGELRRTSQ